MKEICLCIIVLAISVFLAGDAFSNDITTPSAPRYGEDSKYYAKREGHGWIMVEKNLQDLKILGGIPSPANNVNSVSNSGLFLPYMAYPVGSWPEAVAIGDVNGDGRNDVAMVTSYYFDPDNDYKLFVFLQNSSGELDAPIRYATSGIYTARPSTVAIGDVDNDGLADVVIGAGGSVEVFTQNGNGSLNLPVQYQTQDSNKIILGDFNNDGLLDIAGIGGGTGTVSVLLQNLLGTLNSPVTYSVTHGGYDDLEAGDLNNDGLTDIVVMSGQLYAIPNVGVLLQKKDGTLASPAYYSIGVNQLTHGVAVGDITGDGRQDVVVTYGGNSPSSNIGAFIQNAGGTFNPPTSYASYDCPEPVAARDVNSDGKDDVIVLHGGWNAMGVYQQGENGLLASEELYPIPYATHYNPHGLAVGDINGDGLNDVVIADYNHGLVVLRHAPRPESPPIPDIKANGSDGPLEISMGTTLNVTVALDAGTHAGENADWWAAASSPFGTFWYTQQGWSQVQTAGYNGPLFSGNSIATVLNTSALPAGSYTFYFGVDLLMNGMLDLGKLYYNSIAVTIR